MKIIQNNKETLNTFFAAPETSIFDHYVGNFETLISKDTSILRCSTGLCGKLRKEGQIDLSISLNYVPEDIIHSLNSQFRGRDEVTDVLSFGYMDNHDRLAQTNGASIGDSSFLYSDDIIGEVAICLEYLKNEERLTLEEVLRMTIHGTLHILGWTHQGKLLETNEKNYIEPMFALQEKLVLACLG